MEPRLYRGVPLTTLDVDFMFRKTPRNLQKLKQLAKDIDGHLDQPFKPMSDMYRLLSNEAQIDFVQRMDGVKSFESLRSRAVSMKVGEENVRVASLDDIIKSKKAAQREKDLAALPILEKTLAVRRAANLSD